MRTIVIGDVHGCFNELRALLVKCDHRPSKDRLIFIGDLVDKGPSSFDVVQLAADLQAELVLGNHEEKFLRFHKHETVKANKPGYKNPMKFGDDKLELYEELRGAGLIPYLEKAVPFLTVGMNVIVHAGLVPGIELTRQDVKQIIRLRYIHKETGKMLSLTEDLKQPADSVFWTERWVGPGNVFFGHTAANLHDVVQTISAGGRTFALDTGCVYGGKLTAAVFEYDHDQPRFEQVAAAQAYAPYYESGE